MGKTKKAACKAARLMSQTHPLPNFIQKSPWETRWPNHAQATRAAKHEDPFQVLQEARPELIDSPPLCRPPLRSCAVQAFECASEAVRLKSGSTGLVYFT